MRDRGIESARHIDKVRHWRLIDAQTSAISPHSAATIA